jgi:hypothetical protein
MFHISLHMGYQPSHRSTDSLLILKMSSRTFDLLLFIHLRYIFPTFINMEPFTCVHDTTSYSPCEQTVQSFSLIYH